MIGLFNIYLAGGALPDAGGFLDQDWEIVRAFAEVLAPRFGGIPERLARMSFGF